MDRQTDRQMLDRQVGESFPSPCKKLPSTSSNAHLLEQVVLWSEATGWGWARCSGSHKDKAKVMTGRHSFLQSLREKPRLSSSPHSLCWLDSVPAVVGLRSPLSCGRMSRATVLFQMLPRFSPQPLHPQDQQQRFSMTSRPSRDLDL